MVKVSRPTRGTNEVHFACFSCRKSFKQRGSSNWDTHVPRRPFPCPECKQPMVRLGRYFKAPPQRATRQWIKVELLHHFGEQFHAGNSGLWNTCRTLPATVTYLVGSARTLQEVRAALGTIQRLRSH
jgi:hypothetical protein